MGLPQLNKAANKAELYSRCLSFCLFNNNYETYSIVPQCVLAMHGFSNLFLMTPPNNFEIKFIQK